VALVELALMPAQATGVAPEEGFEAPISEVPGEAERLVQISPPFVHSSVAPQGRGSGPQGLCQEQRLVGPPRRCYGALHKRQLRERRPGEGHGDAGGEGGPGGEGRARLEVSAMN